MAEIKDKVQNALDENRMVVLVVQVLVGFQCKGIFEPGFERLPESSRSLKLVAFALLLSSLALLLMTPPYHRLVEKGEDTPRFHAFVTRIMELALIQFALGMAVDFYVPAQKLFGTAGGVMFSAGMGIVMAWFWYGIETLRRRQPRTHHMEVKKTMSDQTTKTELKDKIKQVLTEGRVVLPGTQALLGFQLITFLTDAFEKLPRSSQLLHFASTLLVALSAILLMTPPAYHRLVERGEDSEHFHRLAGRFVIGAMVPLALGISSEFYIVSLKITLSTALAATFGSAVLVTFIGLWFVFPLLQARGTPAVIVPAVR
ncbi:MAG: hypothetical protein QOD99_1684 [Chthoniobacter sp.]|nr:hypothetical protein [Chthoniobacter sp.]